MPALRFSPGGHTKNMLHIETRNVAMAKNLTANNPSKEPKLQSCAANIFQQLCKFWSMQQKNLVFIKSLQNSKTYSSVFLFLFPLFASIYQNSLESLKANNVTFLIKRNAIKQPFTDRNVSRNLSY